MLKEEEKETDNLLLEMWKVPVKATINNQVTSDCWHTEKNIGLTILLIWLFSFVPKIILQILEVLHADNLFLPKQNKDVLLFTTTA